MSGDDRPITPADKVLDYGTIQDGKLRRTMLDVFRSRKMAVLSILGFSSGLPLFLTQRTLQAWLTTSGLDLSTIGFISLIGLPYALKFVWSPFVDRFSFPFLGRRRGWIAVTQLMLAATIALVAVGNPASDLRFVAAIAFLIAFFSATHDIVVDAYNADIVDAHETGPGAAIKVLGYRIALIVTGSAMLVVADRTSWSTAYTFAAALMLAVMLISFFAPEPTLDVRPPETLVAAVRMPFEEFFYRHGFAKAVMILVFIVIYRVSDSMIVNMATPFLLQTGFSLTDVGAFQSGLGLVITIAGVVAGGAVISRIGIIKSLWVFGVLQAFSSLAYWLVSQAGKNYGFMLAAIIAENASTGLATAALVGFLISLCNQRFSATQYALLSSLMAVGRDVIVAPSGALAKAVGWPSFFLISFVAAFPGLMLLAVMNKERD